MDFSTDAEAAVQYLQNRKEINPKQIGLIGHSEGGIIAPMIASRSKDVAFIVLLAGTGLRGDKVLLKQQELIGKASGVNNDIIQKLLRINKDAFDIVIQNKDSAELSHKLTTYFAKVLQNNPLAGKPESMNEDDFVKLQVNKMMIPWIEYFLRYDPAPALEKVKCPVLALNGTKDLQVAPNENIAAIKAALAKGGNKNITTKELSSLNHLFQDCTTGPPGEYATIEQSFSSTALHKILSWIQLQVKQ